MAQTMGYVVRGQFWYKFGFCSNQEVRVMRLRGCVMIGMARGSTVLYVCHPNAIQSGCQIPDSVQVTRHPDPEARGAYINWSHASDP